MMEYISYFTCTLGQAIQVNRNEPAPYKTITEFLDYQAQTAPDRPAVGFPDPHDEVLNGESGGKWGNTLYCKNETRLNCVRVNVDPCTAFKKLHQCSLASAQLLGKLISPIASGQESGDSSQTVALLCPSSIEFLFSWLGLMQLGYSVLLVAYILPSPLTLVCD